MSKKYKIITKELVTYEEVIEAEDFYKALETYRFGTFKRISPRTEIEWDFQGIVSIMEKGEE